jgi:hypothetical protein
MLMKRGSLRLGLMMVWSSRGDLHRRSQDKHHA